jgi:hypothetical protein
MPHGCNGARAARYAMLGLAAVGVFAACQRPVDVRVLPDDPTPQDVSLLVSQARGVPFERHGGWKDRQKLWVLTQTARGTDTLVPGPVAEIQPVRSLGDKEDRDFDVRAGARAGGWRVVALITSEAAYEQLHLRAEPDTNFLVIRRRGGQWEARMLSTGDAVPAPLTITPEPHEGSRRPPGVARWVYDPNDDTIWIRCGSGCCIVDGVPRETQ